MDIINLDSTGLGIKVDFVRLDGNFFVHKQIEQKNGLTFMRMKKRAVFRV